MAIPSCIGSVVLLLLASQATAQQIDSLLVRNTHGVQLRVMNSDVPTLDVILPGHEREPRTINVLFPEHVTARVVGDSSVVHLYLSARPSGVRPPQWRRLENALEYSRMLDRGVRLIARATLDSDGVRFTYTFANLSNTAYAMIYAVTDPRLTGVLHDERLERTYVHHANGFDLLASETPERLTMPLMTWLPARYLASYTWPVPASRVQRREDGITYYNKSRRVDEPFIATVSSDQRWVVASFARTVGNVWSNPELTCQHVDASTSLAPNAEATTEMKVLVLRGTLEEAFRRERAERETLR